MSKPCKSCMETTAVGNLQKLIQHLLDHGEVREMQRACVDPCLVCVTTIKNGDKALEVRGLRVHYKCVNSILGWAK